MIGRPPLMDICAIGFPDFTFTLKTHDLYSHLLFASGVAAVSNAMPNVSLVANVISFAAADESGPPKPGGILSTQGRMSKPGLPPVWGSPLPARLSQSVPILLQRGRAKQWLRQSGKQETFCSPSHSSQRQMQTRSHR